MAAAPSASLWPALTQLCAAVQSWIGHASLDRHATAPARCVHSACRGTSHGIPCLATQSGWLPPQCTPAPAGLQQDAKPPAVLRVARLLNQPQHERQRVLRKAASVQAAAAAAAGTHQLCLLSRQTGLAQVRAASLPPLHLQTAAEGAIARPLQHAAQWVVGHAYSTSAAASSKRRSWADAPRLTPSPKSASKPLRAPPAATAGGLSAPAGSSQGSAAGSQVSSSSSFAHGEHANIGPIRVNVQAMTTMMKGTAYLSLLLGVPLASYCLWVSWITTGMDLMRNASLRAIGAARIHRALLAKFLVRWSVNTGVAGALVEQISPSTTPDAYIEVVKALELMMDVDEGRAALVQAGLAPQLRLGLQKGWLPSGLIPWATLVVEHLENEASQGWRPPSTRAAA